MGNTALTRRVLQGIVVSSKMDKTVVVEVKTYKTHPIYKKRVQYRKKFKAHDENNEAHVGDTVQIMQTRPLSKDKCWRVIEILERAK